jgi:apolipoprotein D and lipocalin family protein
MKTLRQLVALFSFVVSFAALALALALALTQAPVASLPSVDLVRYGGKWFEITSFPIFFQRNCIADTTAEYAPAVGGGVTVRNRCRTNSGFDEATGKATLVEGFGNSRLKVSFFWPFKADYWILGLDPEYRWAVVGNPNRKYLWVLSRTAQLPPGLLEGALASASAQGFDLSHLRYTAQASQSAT